MIDYENMRNIVVKGLKDYLQCPVIRTNQNEEPPAYPYVSYTITTLASENKGTYGEYSDGQDRKPITQTWSITAQSDKSGEDIELIMKAREWLERVGNLYLNDNNIIVQSVGNVSNRDNVLTMEYEYKHGFDVVFWLFDTVENPITKDDVIESVSFDDTTIEKVDYPKIIEELNAEIEKMNVENKNMNAEIEKKNAEILSLKRRCNVYYPILGEDGYYTDKPVPIPYSVEYDSLLINSDNTFLFSTPEISKDGTMKFSYWNVFKVDENGNKTQEVLSKCYEYNFGLKVVTNCYIEPVYGEKIPALTANITISTYSREVTASTDKIFVRLLTAFTSTVIPTFKENNTDLSVQCGVFVVRNNTNKLTEEERNQLVTAALNGEADTTSEILNIHKMSDETSTELLNKLDALAKDLSVKDKTNTLATFGGDEYRITKFIFDNNTLTNKNRIEEVLRYTNNTANQNYIFTAYAYVIIRNADGSIKEMVISDEQYFNICYFGNKA